MKTLILVCFALLGTIKIYAQTLYPYLQSIQPNSVYVTWKTSSNPQTLVEYGLTPTSLVNTVNGTNQIWTDNGYSNNYYYHSAKMTGLNPNTKYYYKITTGTQTSAVCSFKTLPLPGQPATADGKIRFLIMGDNQIKDEPRYDSLVSCAKRKIEQKYTGEPNDNISLTFMVGDQVDVGTLDHYENVHFDKNKLLSPYIPIQTTVGNHELYGTLQMTAYYNHFYLDSLSYQGIYSGTENYYAMQAGPILFISMTTEHSSVNAAQLAWLQQLLTAADADTTVQWIISYGHRPYQAEQYVGDISTWVRNTAVPLLKTSPKYVLHIGAHHHLYARGQLKNEPVYNVISGGTAWDQYWGMSTEQDMDDVQKTLPQWAYTLLEFDVNNQTMDAETYSIGSKYAYRNNKLIDIFHRYKNKQIPSTPTLNAIPDSLSLPYTIGTSAFNSPEGELMNSTEFQIAQSASFSSAEVDVLKDFEDFFSPAGAPDTTNDLNLGVNILNLNMQSTGPTSLVNGWHYVRARHRDRNMEWSNWSPIDSFKVYGSQNGLPELATDTTAYELIDSVYVTYSNGLNVPYDWIGIYHKGETPGSVPASAWSYTSGASGVLPFKLTTADEYFVAYFTANGYTEVAPRDSFYVGPIPVLTSDFPNYASGTNVNISYTNCPGFAQDGIRIYIVGKIPGTDPSAAFLYTTGASGVKTFTGLPDGYYFANYYLKNGYTAPGQRIFFSVGDTITQLWINKSIYNVGEYIAATWVDGPGIVKDWLGIYDTLGVPTTGNMAVPYISYTYFGGVPAGSMNIADSLLPKPSTDSQASLDTGRYFVVMFTNDSYTEVSNRCYFQIINQDASTGFDGKVDPHSVQVYPNPTQDKSYIQSDYPIDKVELLNEDGQTVFSSTNTTGSSYTLLHNDLPAGVYFLKVHSRKLFTYKIIVTR